MTRLRAENYLLRGELNGLKLRFSSTFGSIRRRGLIAYPLPGFKMLLICIDRGGTERNVHANSFLRYLSTQGQNEAQDVIAPILRFHAPIHLLY